jgi:hypothetical protein
MKGNDTPPVPIPITLAWPGCPAMVTGGAAGIGVSLPTAGLSSSA